MAAILTSVGQSRVIDNSISSSCNSQENTCIRFIKNEFTLSMIVAACVFTPEAKAFLSSHIQDRIHSCWTLGSSFSWLIPKNSNFLFFPS